MIDTKLIAAVAISAVAASLPVSAAHAQTAVRTLKVEPGETTVTQGPDGSTVVTRRPLENAPAPMTFTPPPLNTLMNPPAEGAAGFVPPPSRAAPPPVVHTETQPETQAGTQAGSEVARRPPRKPVRSAAPPARRAASTRTASRAKPAVAPRVHVAAKPAARTARSAGKSTARSTAKPLRLASAPVLDAVQRQYIYGAIMEQGTLPQTAIPFADPVVVPPAVAAIEIVTPRRQRPIAYAVGSRLPVSVPLMAVPAAASEHMRWLAGYSYAIVNNRVLLVDPNTGVVVADLTQ